jgi:hypothetical protein
MWSRYMVTVTRLTPGCARGREQSVGSRYPLSDNRSHKESERHPFSERGKREGDQISTPALRAPSASRLITWASGQRTPFPAKRYLPPSRDQIRLLRPSRVRTHPSPDVQVPPRAPAASASALPSLRRGGVGRMGGMRSQGERRMPRSPLPVPERYSRDDSC